MPDLPGSVPPAASEDRAAIAFLERFLADRARGAPTDLSIYLADFPGFAARIAREWLAATQADAAATAPPSAPPPPAGDQHLGPYRLERELGRGGQGVVYQATDTRLGRTVALKVLNPQLGALGGAAELRLRREAEALARLEHPGIATVFEIGTDPRGMWLAMRLVPGGTLQHTLARQRETGQGPPRTAAALAAVTRLGERAARALQVAHRAGIVHRDIKPANLLLQSPDEPVLTDFGLARDEHGATPTITEPGAVFGTLCYLAPERLRGAAADSRADVYGLGAVLFEALTLRRPFAAATTAAELQAIARDAAPDVRSVHPAVPRDLAVVVATALAPDPVHRYQSAEALADDLARVLAHQPIHARPAGVVTRLVRFAQRNRALAASLLLVFVLLLTGLATTTSLWRSTQRALADVTRLADLKLARDLRARAEGLWPARPELHPAMREWLAAARRLQEHRPDHAALRARLPADDTDPTVAWQREQAEALHQELADLDSRIAAVQARADVAASLAARTVDAVRPAWTAAAARVHASTRYRSLELRPQLGLIPLGPDPDSGLEEFAHASSGAVPQRDPTTARLVLGPDSGVVLVLVPGGTAVLGAERVAPADGHAANLDPSVGPDLGPSYTVELAPFFLGKFELTQGQWRRHTGRNPSAYQSGPGGLVRSDTARHPVEQVAWDEADRVLRELDLAMPTEAQWEWAWRAGARTPYPGGTEAHSLAGCENLADRSAREQGGSPKWTYVDWSDGYLLHAPVGSFRGNAWGLFDLGGNVKEWCADSWEDYPDAAPRAGDGLRRGAHERYRVIRGGCFASAGDDPRCAARGGVERTAAGAECGVRPARRIE